MKKKLLIALLPFLVLLSALAMVQQFVLHYDPFVHHAFICATIIAYAAWAGTKFGTTRIMKLCIAFAIFGMGLGILEAAAMLVHISTGGAPNEHIDIIFSMH